MIKTGFLTFCGIVLGTLLAGCGEQAQVESTAPADPAAPTAPAGGTPDYLDELQKLASLRDAGILTDEEFNAKKAQILGLS